MTPRRHAALLAALLAVYAAVSVRAAATRPIFYDEVYTDLLAGTDLPGGLWAALAAGTDLNPPGYYYWTRAFREVAGTGTVPLRLPAVAAYGVMLGLMFWYLARAVSLPAAWVGVTFLLGSNLPYYATMARAYAALLAAAAGVLLCHHLAGAARTRAGRRAALAGLAASAAVGVSMHYYAVLLAVPVAAAEAARFARDRRIDWAALAAAGAGLAVVAAWWPLIAVARTYSATFWARANWGRVEECYAGVFTNFAAPLVLALGATAAGRASDRPGPGAVALAAAAGFAALPVVGVALGVFVTTAFDKRYVLPAYLGVGALLAAAASRARWWPLVAAAFVGWYLLGAELRHRQAAADARATAAWADAVRAAAGPDRPIVPAHGHAFLHLYYNCPDLRDRLVYLSDPARELAATGSDTNDRNLTALARVAGLRVEPFGRFAPPAGTVVVGEGEWQVADLRAAGYRLTRVWERPGAPGVYRVELETPPDPLPGRPPAR